MPANLTKRLFAVMARRTHKVITEKGTNSMKLLISFSPSRVSQEVFEDTISLFYYLGTLLIITLNFRRGMLRAIVGLRASL